MAGGVNVPLGSTWDPKGVKRAQQDLSRFNQQAKGFTSGISKSFLSLGAGLGAGLGLSAIVGQLGDMAATAAEDQASVTKLSVALRNMGLASQQSGVEEFVKQTMLATGVVDDQLRPALARLLRSTGDVTLSQKALGTALNISAATGKDLDTVANGIGKAYDGNVASLGRLGVGLDKSILKSGNMVAIMAELDRKFAGQSAAAAETYSGKLQRIATAADEAKESIGYALLGALDDLGNSLGGTEGAVSGISALGDGIAQIIDQSASGVSAIRAVVDALKDGAGASEEGSLAQKVWNESVDAAKNTAVNFLTGGLYSLGGAYDELKSNVSDASVATNRYKHDLQAQWDASRDATDANDDNAASLDGVAGKANKAASQIDRFRASLDKLYGGQQSRIEDRIGLKRMRAEGPNKSGSRGTGKNKVEFATADDARLWAIDYAQQAAQYAGDFKSSGKQAQILANAQAYIASQVGKYGVGKPGAFASSLIGPDAATGTATRGWQNMYGVTAPTTSGQVVNIAIQSVQVASGAAFDQLIKEAQRTAAASGGRFGDRYSAAVTR